MNASTANAEVTLRIVYQPQAVFRIRPVNRCSATIAGTYLTTSIPSMLLLSSALLCLSLGRKELSVCLFRLTVHTFTLSFLLNHF